MHFNWDTSYAPKKDIEYLIHKYVMHPIYSYTVMAIKKCDEAKAVFVYRKQEYRGKYVIRIVDYLGDESLMYIMGIYIKNEMNNEKYEYADFYEFGFDETQLCKAGFVKRNGDANIIPNHFYPYEKKNIDIWIDYPNVQVKFCKGDSDQDRPVRR